MTSATQLEPQPKRQRLTKKIGTHNGTFHCDEALAVFLLKQTATYASADVVRTRDPAILDGCDIVVDVGAVYDAEKLRFDHHQRGFTDVHFGQEIIANRLNAAPDDPKVKYVWLKVYRDFIEALDAIDNGISQYPTDIQPRYRNKTDLSSRVGSLNPRWNEPTDSTILDARFQEASSLAGKEFLQVVDYYRDSWLPAGDLVKELIAWSKANVDSSGKIILFQQFAPWKEHLFELESSEGGGALEPNQAIYVVYPDEIGGNWRVQAVPVAPSSFESRKPLPEAWRGVRDGALSQLTGIAGCVFVHASGFIGGNKTKEGALEMAKKALEL
ncbi:GAMM1 protein [Coprinopsis cinerea okayama7|uniref:GAMM1 protein n=1 Tax=Coprinopsis cinerea (strain Okayama-7 / 130 / ATCC MYA-4618 / FGSC 9003) TaxID=240176 RepID=D6RJN9_COPC7|nr:GAMM1 protein [Coprinopsis cinerea okayama7\|eukprot:XP_002912112.1 GAMM1 protein [Coprinopsis cinerea okayama7\